MVTSVVDRRKALTCQRIILSACMPVCRTASTDALKVLVGVAPLNLEVIKRGIAFKIKKGLPLLAHDWVSANNLANRDVKSLISLLHECLIDKWKSRWTN